MSGAVSAEVQADRDRVRAIMALPEAIGAPFAAAALAVEGATIDEAQVVLRIANSTMTPAEVAAKINATVRR